MMSVDLLMFYPKVRNIVLWKPKKLVVSRM